MLVKSCTRPLESEETGQEKESRKRWLLNASYKETIYVKRLSSALDRRQDVSLSERRRMYDCMELHGVYRAGPPPYSLAQVRSRVR